MGKRYNIESVFDNSQVNTIESMRVTLKPLTIIRIEKILNRRIRAHSVDSELNIILDIIGGEAK